MYGRNVYGKNACIWEFASRRVAGFYNTRNTLTQNTLRKDNVIPIFWGAFRVVRVLCLFMLVRGTVMSLEMSNKMKALVLEHSFIKRLRRWMRSNGRSMSTRKHDVHLYGVGGRTIAKTYYNDLKVVRRKRPDVVFLQVGSNDILKESSPTIILARMKRLVSVLLEKYHVSTVIVGSVVCRRKSRGLSRRAYDRKKQKINKFLSKEFGTSKRGKKSFFFPHKFFKEKYFDRDGIHLNQDGNR